MRVSQHHNNAVSVRYERYLWTCLSLLTYKGYDT